MRQWDLTPLFRSAIGFDRLANLLENSIPFEAAENFPPYNIEKTGEESYRVTMAVAGFTPEELSVVQEQNLLVVSARKEHDERRQYLHCGIATRAFERRFELAEFVKVESATMRDGLLTVELVREVPEEMRPRRIGIAVPGAAPKAIEGETQKAKQIEKAAA